MGGQAAKKLVYMLENNDNGSESVIKIAGTLIERDSVKKYHING